MNAPLPHDATLIVRKELVRRIEQLRNELEHPEATEWVNITRGEVRALRSLLTWIDPSPAAPEPESRRLSTRPNY